MEDLDDKPLTNEDMQRIYEKMRDQISVDAIKQRRKAREAEEEDHVTRIRRPAGLPPERS